MSSLPLKVLEDCSNLLDTPHANSAKESLQAKLKPTSKYSLEAISRQFYPHIYEKIFCEEKAGAENVPGGVKSEDTVNNSEEVAIAFLEKVEGTPFREGNIVDSPIFKSVTGTPFTPATQDLAAYYTPAAQLTGGQCDNKTPSPPENNENSESPSAMASLSDQLNGAIERMRVQKSKLEALQADKEQQAAGSSENSPIDCPPTANTSTGKADSSNRQTFTISNSVEKASNLQSQLDAVCNETWGSGRFEEASSLLSQPHSTNKSSSRKSSRSGKSPRSTGEAESASASPAPEVSSATPGPAEAPVTVHVRAGRLQPKETPSPKPSESSGSFSGSVGAGSLAGSSVSSRGPGERAGPKQASKQVERALRLENLLRYARRVDMEDRSKSEARHKELAMKRRNSVCGSAVVPKKTLGQSTKARFGKESGLALLETSLDSLGTLLGEEGEHLPASLPVRQRSKTVVSARARTASTTNSAPPRALAAAQEASACTSGLSIADGDVTDDAATTVSVQSMETASVAGSVGRARSATVAANPAHAGWSLGGLDRSKRRASVDAGPAGTPQAPALAASVHTKTVAERKVIFEAAMQDHATYLANLLFDSPQDAPEFHISFSTDQDIE